RKDDNEASDVAKADAEKTKEVKEDNKKAGPPPTSSSLSISSGFSNQFLNLSSNKSMSPTLLNVNVTVISKQPVPTTSSVVTTKTPVSTVPPPPPVQLFKRVFALEKDVQELKQVNHSPAILTIIRSQVPATVDEYLGSSLGHAFQKIKKEMVKKQQMPEYSVKSSNKAALDEYD
ncbi:hypothetical protein Tco_0957870, partial [Tanacetum coccineum]